MEGELLVLPGEASVAAADDVDGGNDGGEVLVEGHGDGRRGVGGGEAEPDSALDPDRPVRHVVEVLVKEARFRSKLTTDSKLLQKWLVGKIAANAEGFQRLFSSFTC